MTAINGNQSQVNGYQKVNPTHTPKPVNAPAPTTQAKPTPQTNRASSVQVTSRQSSAKPPKSVSFPTPSAKSSDGLTIPTVSTNINGVNINIDPKGIQQIMRCEEYIPPPGKNLKDGGGVTVGYGHTGGGTVKSKQDAVRVLAQDIKTSIEERFKAIPKEVLSKLNQDQLNALASAAMNLSPKGFKNFAPVKALLEEGKSVEQRISNAGQEFVSKLRKGFGGLVWRRATEALTFSGTYVTNPAKDAVPLATKKGLLD